MSHIKNKDTSIETTLRKALWHKGIRYRKNYDKLPGKPDIAITKYKIAIFCDGEFWHGEDWERRKERLAGNREYWISKIERNISRDNETDAKLEALGWIVLRFWGKDIQKNLTECAREVRGTILEVLAERYAERCYAEGIGYDQTESEYAAESAPGYNPANS
jgi:DNA mismatch endonuclease (patch repair protein)